MNVLFFGTPDFSCAGLEALLTLPDVKVVGVVTQPDRRSGRGGKIQSPPVKLLADRHGIKVFQPTSIRKELPNFLAEMRSLGPIDIGVVIAFGQILPKTVLDLPKSGCVNVHASLLPRWRGAAPIQRSILAGDSETGICLMKMDEGLDTGDVYIQSQIPIGLRDTSDSIHSTLSSLGAELLKAEIFNIVQGNLLATPQPSQGITYAAKILAAEAALNFQVNSLEMARTVRALSPSPGAFTLFKGKRLKILMAQAVQIEIPAGTVPGTVITALPDRIEVCAGDGILRLEELQLEGKKRMKSDEFLRGTPLSSGDFLGV